MFVLNVGTNFVSSFHIILFLTNINIFYLIQVVYDKLKTTLNLIAEKIRFYATKLNYLCKVKKKGNFLHFTIYGIKTSKSTLLAFKLFNRYQKFVAIFLFTLLNIVFSCSSFTKVIFFVQRFVVFSFAACTYFALYFFQHSVRFYILKQVYVFVM